MCGDGHREGEDHVPVNDGYYWRDEDRGAGGADGVD
jgi:hypothetical protein